MVKRRPTTRSNKPSKGAALGGAGSGASEPGSNDFGLAPLSSFPPALVIRDENDRVGELILALALWFNDLKDLLLAWETITTISKASNTLGVSGTNGQIIGIRTHILRFSFGALHELLELLGNSENRVVLEDREMVAALGSLSPKSRAAWDLLVQHVDTKPANGGSRVLRRVIARIRHSLAFHYYKPADLAAGFRKHFHADATEPHRTAAYWSLGKTAAGSRFYFADAAVQAALEDHLLKDGVDIIFALDAANQAVRMVVEGFIELRKHPAQAGGGHAG